MAEPLQDLFDRGDSDVDLNSLVVDQTGKIGPLSSMRLQSPLTRYGLPVATTGLISLLFFLVDSNDLNTDLRCFAFAAAILLSALLGGLGPGLLATGLSAFANAYLFFAPIFSVRIASEEKIARLVLFTGEGILLAFIGTLFRDNKTVNIGGSWTRYLPAMLFVSTATGIKLLAFLVANSITLANQPRRDAKG